MGKVPRRRPLTGCIRRGTKRDCSSARRAMQLSHAEVGFRELLQGFIAVSARISRSAMLAISPVAVTYMLVTGGNRVANNQIAPATATAAITVSLLRILFAGYANASLHLARLFRMDYWRRRDAVDHECQGRIFGSIAGPSRNAMTSRRSRGTSREGYSLLAYMPSGDSSR